MKSAIQKANEAISKINPRYDMKQKEIEEIYENIDSPIKAICVSFRFGYLQGIKAAKAEMRKGGAVNA